MSSIPFLCDIFPCTVYDHTGLDPWTQCISYLLTAITSSKLSHSREPQYGYGSHDYLSHNMRLNPVGHNWPAVNRAAATLAFDSWKRFELDFTSKFCPKNEATVALTKLELVGVGHCFAWQVTRPICIYVVNFI
jgi:hypothetical protein